MASLTVGFYGNPMLRIGTRLRMIIESSRLIICIVTFLPSVIVIGCQGGQHRPRLVKPEPEIT